MFYENVQSVLLTLLFWWIALLIYQRLANRYPKRNTWKRDITFTFFQSILVMIALPVLTYFIEKFD
ncbi:hypothetical protein A8F94_15545 [Bacillus sp. FJAT-27225]|uniref:hypothetical protein n=1 Tax=Bacillus sp. FJAT-27225 TaxID=1743144 RepID=UPI00080C3550|nr:hypothetical protein [Bacillus sp. FJAT-27225]OCA84135.1 hypothetical protein A8F94_15545 [Bacillus sp. FJAT-27225]